MSLPPLDLSGGFETVTRDDWLAAAATALRGGSVESLTSRRGGLEIEPLYTSDDVGAEPRVISVDREGHRRRWDVRQQHGGNDASEVNDAVLHDLARGVRSIELVPGPDLSLADALAGVFFDIAPVALAPHADLARAAELAAVVRADGADRHWLGLDPFVAAPGDGSPVVLFEQAALLEEATGGCVPITIDTVRYAEAGATQVQEVAWAWAAGIDALRRLEDAGVTAATGATFLGFRVSARADQFATVAALRAFRVGWAAILEACGVQDSAPALVHAVTPRSMMSRRESSVNWMRATTATVGAVVGGADAVTVVPHDVSAGESTAFSRRVARNVQLVLLEESHLARLVDPAAGSWFVEALTTQMADSAWTELRAVERRGGMFTALAEGSIAGAAAESWRDRERGLASRRIPLTGVSEFADLADLGERPPLMNSGDSHEAFPLRRDAAGFESLRDRADRAEERPAVFVAPLGELAEHGARSAWVSNLLAVGGIEARGSGEPGIRSPLEAAARFAASGATVAVVASSDSVYAERAVATATALREAGAAHIVVAGKPADLRAQLESAGVDEFWHTGIDVLERLGDLHRVLGLVETEEERS